MYTFTTGFQGGMGTARPFPPFARLLLAFVVVHCATDAAYANRSCPGGCNAQVKFGSDPPVAVNFNVVLDITEFEKMSSTVRRAKVLSNDLTSPGATLTTRSRSEVSYFYLTSRSPTGTPFFPADARGEYFFTMQLSAPPSTLTNGAPMVITAANLPAFPPPSPAVYLLDTPVTFSSAPPGTTVTVQSGTVTIVSDDYRPALPGWAGIALGASLFVAGTLVFGKRRRVQAT
jgi:hypothetical protein